MPIPGSSSTTLGTEGPEESDKNSEPLIPGLPDEIAELCLLFLPYPYQALARSVSSSWKRAITDASFLIYKTALSLSLPYIFVLAFQESTASIQWQSLDPRSRRWFVLPPIPCTIAACQSGIACASLPRQGKLFVLGGNSLRSGSETATHTTFVYATSTNQWSVTSPMPFKRSYFAAGSIKGKIIAVGESEPSTTDQITAAEGYDPESDTWTEVATLGMRLVRYDSAVVENRMYVTEGWTWPFRYSPRGGVYDPDENRWRMMSKGMREGWSGLSVVLGGRLFVISEYGDCPMKVYVPDDDTWRYVGGEKLPREAMKRPFAVNGVEGRIYVVSRGLHVAVGKVFEGNNKKWEFRVEWEVMAAPETFNGFSPLNCQVLYG
ncbi:F-box protein AFR [Juglans microcarpa x Juglans regia]|uniref:F-box protein AFR n=1 Tax=Juglans microcarpa x Juglans regia TaxID=2249226 RepID=UPI001B7DD88C|nr:F-box protein AFR [Juglans microcarpa x Juglans regia]